MTTLGKVASRAGIGVSVVVLLALVVDQAWVTDDALITFRYVDNLLAGHGLVFNRGERLEAFSSPLFAGLLAAFGALGANLFSTATILGVLFTLAELVAIVLLLHKRSALAAVLAALLFSTDRIVFVWATGGLETAMYSALLFSSFALTIAQLESSTPAQLVVGASAAHAMLWLSRPEGIAFYPLYLTALVWSSWRHGIWVRLLLRSLLVVVTSVACLLGARFLYYGALLPHTFAAKVAGVPRLELGGGYLAAFAQRMGLLTTHALAWLGVAGALALALILARRTLGTPRGESQVLRIGLVGAAYVGLAGGMVLYEGGDYMTDFRFLRPIMGILYSAVAVACAYALSSQARPARAVAAVAVLAFLVTHGMRGLAPTPMFGDAPPPGEHKRFLTVEQRRSDEFRAALFQIAQPGDSLLTDFTGYKGYGHELRTVDATGLTALDLDGNFTLRPMWSEARKRERLPGHARWPTVEYMVRDGFTFLFPKIRSNGHDSPEVHSRSPQRHREYPFLHVTMALGSGEYFRFFTTLSADELDRRGRAKGLDLCWRIPMGERQCAGQEEAEALSKEPQAFRPGIQGHTEHAPLDSVEAVTQYFGAMAAADCSWMDSVTAGMQALLDRRLTCKQRRAALLHAPIHLLEIGVERPGGQEDRRLISVRYSSAGKEHRRFVQVSRIDSSWRVTEL